MTAVFPGVVATKGGHWEKILKTNPGHAKNLAKKLNQVYKTTEFEVYQLTNGDIVPL